MFRVTDIPHRGPQLVLVVAAPLSMEEVWSDALESHHNQVVGVALALDLHHQDCSNTNQVHVRKVSNNLICIAAVSIWRLHPLLIAYKITNLLNCPNRPKSEM